MHRPLNQEPLTTMTREQSWSVTALESHEAAAFACVVVHRVPLNNGEDLCLLTDSGPNVPGSTVSAVVDWDTPTRAVRRRLPEFVDADDPFANFWVIEPVEVLAEWAGLGVAELLLATVLTDLRSEDDIMAVAAPVTWYLNLDPPLKYSRAVETDSESL